MAEPCTTICKTVWEDANKHDALEWLNAKPKPCHAPNGRLAPSRLFSAVLTMVP